MTACPECKAASERAHHVFRSDCKGCAARALGRSPSFFQSSIDGVLMPEYRRALALLDLTHDAVKTARAADKGDQ